MKTLRLIAIAVGLLSAATAHAQLDVVLTMPYTTYMQGESVLATVTIRNKTAQPINASEAAGYTLFFDIKDADGLPVLPREGRSLTSPTLPAGDSITFTNDLLATHRILEIRQASLTASVDYQGSSFVSKKIYLDIQDGTEINRLRVPNGKDTYTQSLRVLQRTRHEHLFLRVDNEAAGVTYGSIDLGVVLRNTPPEFMLDSSGSTHILQRSGPEEYTYHVAAPDGTFTKIERFTGDYQIVRLIVSSTGQITCNGLPGDKKDRPQMLQQTPFRADLHRDLPKR